MAKTRPWRDSGKHEAMVLSGAKLLRFVFSEPGITPEHQRHVLRDALWSVTEMDGKYTTRYRSRDALAVESEAADPRWQSQLRHDHVVTRDSLAKRIRAGEDPEAVLREAVACVVTKDEHDRLTPFDRTHAGWGRYLAAGIEVIDMSTGETIDLAK